MRERHKVGQQSLSKPRSKASATNKWFIFFLFLGRVRVKWMNKVLMMSGIESSGALHVCFIFLFLK